MEQTLEVHRSLRPPMPMAQQEMDEFWRDRQKEIEMTKDFSEHTIPMARLKKVASSQKGNMMMTFDMPAFLSKMCELFVQELAVRAWACAQSHNRCIILDTDIAEAIASTESYDFLVDILHNHRVKQKSTPCSTLTTKRCRLVDKPSSSHHPRQHLMPQFGPTCTSTIPITPSLMPPISQCTPSSFPSLPQEVFPLMAPTPILNRSMLFNIARGLGLQGNNISAVANNNVLDNIVGCSSSTVLASLMSPALLGPSGAPLNLNSQSYICTMNMINSNDASGSNNSNIIVANQASLAPPGHFNPVTLQFPCSSFLHSNKNDMIVAIPEGVDIRNTMHVMSDVDAATTVFNGQEEQHEKETNVELQDQNEIYESIDIGIINATARDGNKCNISWDELGMSDDSLLDNFLDEIQVRKDDVLDTRIALNKDPFLGDVLLSNPSISNGSN
uniref:Core Histone H2A/H2B/H3 domain-containing protein n=1 Tax=Oryza punctata TaxID=4537 RepID=A0A0E0JI66_ORYPU